jgi:hypothetical protein
LERGPGQGPGKKVVRVQGGEDPPPSERNDFEVFKLVFGCVSWFNIINERFSCKSK